MTYLAQERNTQPETRDYLNKIDTSSKFLIGLINDVLDMSKAESDDITLKPEPYTKKEFYEYLDAVIRPLCTSKHQEFFFDSDFDDRYVLLLDKLRFNQVVFNLLSNASKYTPQGGKVTYQSYFSEIKPDGTIDCTLIFSDNGIGMSKEFQKVLFEPFSRENRKETSMIQGTGLGLPIVYKVIKLMNGTIDVDSEIGKGTTFTVHLNVPVMSAAELDTMKTAKEGSADLTLLKGKHILVCEDHPINQEIAKTLLEEKEAIVTIAENGKLGVETFEESAIGFYDLILMDIRMPKMTGFEASEAIRKLDRPDAQEVPIIAMTADAFVDDVQECYKAGMNHHIAKPIDPEMLYKALLEFLIKKQAS
jgi:Signal transduction histidine kinase